MQRILILGSAGSGKSRLATIIGELLDLEVIHLDYHFWQPGWQKPGTTEWSNTVASLSQKDLWVMDGNYHNTLELRLQYADTVIFLDVSRFLSLKRCFFRYLKFRGKTRPDLRKDCPETLDREFVEWIWYYPIRSKPVIYDIISTKPDITLIELKSKKEVARFIRSVKLEKMKTALEV